MSPARSTNLIWGLSGLNPAYTPFFYVAAAIGLLAGIFGNLGWAKKLWLWLVAGLITGVAAAILSAPTAAAIYGGVTGAGTDLIVAGLRAAGASVIQATFGQGIVSDPLDKVATFLVVWLIVVALPRRFRARFPMASKLPKWQGTGPLANAFSLYTPRGSGLHRLHPLTMLAVVGFCLVAGLALPGAWGPYVIFLAVILPLAAWGQVLPTLLSTALKIALPFAISVFLIQGLFWTNGTPIARVRPTVAEARGPALRRAKHRPHPGRAEQLPAAVPDNTAGRPDDRAGSTRPAEGADLHRVSHDPDRAAFPGESQHHPGRPTLAGLETEGGAGRRIRALLPLVVPLVLGSIVDIEERAIALEARAFSGPAPKPACSSCLIRRSSGSHGGCWCGHWASSLPGS